MEAILKGSSQRGWKTTTSTVNDPSSCSLHSTSKEFSLSVNLLANRYGHRIADNFKMSGISCMTAQLEFRPLWADLAAQFRLLDGFVYDKGRWSSI